MPEFLTPGAYEDYLAKLDAPEAGSIDMTDLAFAQIDSAQEPMFMAITRLTGERVSFDCVDREYRGVVLTDLTREEGQPDVIHFRESDSEEEHSLPMLWVSNFRLTPPPTD